jgi:mono/diheme cytochrome c family protein
MSMSGTSRWTRLGLPALVFLTGSLVVAFTAGDARVSGVPEVTDEAILRGRALVMTHACSGCHSGILDPGVEGYLTGARSKAEEFVINGFTTRPPNLTPDPETGLGRYTDRQIFNALRYGLKPKDTPDVEITSNVPGEGNFPAKPKYLGPPMIWPGFRHLTDRELWDMVAYLKHGVKPVKHEVAPSDAPEDFWVSYYADWNGAYPLPPFPTAQEVAAAAGDEQVQRGRLLVVHHGCGGCHKTGDDKIEAEGWLAGARSPEDTFQIGPFITRARNLTPDNLTGLGRFTERQIFNSLRYGLRPGETPDVEITSTAPGQGNFPANPKYLAPPMPWPAWRHMTDQQLWDIAAYLKRGLKPVRNRVQDSEGPPDFWASGLTEELIGRYPAPPFPTINEQGSRQD